MEIWSLPSYILYSFAALTRKALIWALENKSHVSAQSGIILFLSIGAIWIDRPFELKSLQFCIYTATLAIRLHLPHLMQILYWIYFILSLPFHKPTSYITITAWHAVTPIKLGLSLRSLINIFLNVSIKLVYTFLWLIELQLLIF